MDQIFKGKQKEWAKVVAQAWVDEEFKKRLLADPSAVLKSFGIECPAGVKVNIIETKEDEITIPLPAMPTTLQGSVDELSERVQADWCMITSGCQ